MATWGSTSTLPAFDEFLVDSYQEAAPDNVIRTDMDIGPAKVRQRGTAAPVICSGSMHMTSTEVANFRTFYDNTVNYGADEFDTIHPRTTAAVSVSFIGQPNIQRNGADWMVSFSFEILP